MAASDAKALPIYGVAHRITVPIFNITTGEVLTGGLSGLAATASLDGAAFAATGLTVAEIGTTGFVTVDIDATRMTANTVAVKVTSSTSNSSDAVEVIYPSTYYLPATDSTNKAVLLQSGTGTGQVSLTSGKVALAATGLDAISTTAVAKGSVTSIAHMIVLIFRYLFGKQVVTDTTVTTYATDGTTPLSTFTTTTSSDGETFTRGEGA